MADEGGEERGDLLGAAASEFSREIEDDVDVDADFDTENQSGGGKKKLLFILLGLLLLGGAGAGVYFSGILEDEKPEEVQAEKPTVPPPPETIYFDLPPMLVNMNNSGTKPHFLKIRASLEVTADTDLEALKALSPRILDKFQTYLRELRLDDMKGHAGLHRLRQVLRVRVSAAVMPIEIRDVLFRDILIQ